jgi:exodeoxyribonuclease VII small subunit
MKPSAKPVKFEAALSDLEALVADMENGELPLDQLIEKYEEGMRLVQACNEKLAEAEQKIEVLTASQAAQAAGPVPPADPEGGRAALF